MSNSEWSAEVMGQYVRYVTEWMIFAGAQIPDSHYLMMWEQELKVRIRGQVEVWMREPDTPTTLPMDGSVQELVRAAEIDPVITELERQVPGFERFPQGAKLVAGRSWMDRPSMSAVKMLGTSIRQAIDSSDEDWETSRSVMLGETMINWEPLEWFPTELIVIARAAGISGPFELTL